MMCRKYLGGGAVERFYNFFNVSLIWYLFKQSSRSEEMNENCHIYADSRWGKKKFCLLSYLLAVVSFYLPFPVAFLYPTRIA
jgi:hypothetical protein